MRILKICTLVLGLCALHNSYAVSRCTVNPDAGTKSCRTGVTHFAANAKPSIIFFHNYNNIPLVEATAKIYNPKTSVTYWAKHVTWQIKPTYLPVKSTSRDVEAIMYNAKGRGSLEILVY